MYSMIKAFDYKALEKPYNKKL